MSSSAGYVLTPIRDDAEFAEICALEAASYPADEAASPSALSFRRTQVPSLFRVLRVAPAATGSPIVSSALVGFVCATAAPTGTRALAAASMSSHSAGGTVACVHSVVVAADARRRGAGSALVRLYVAELRAAGYERALLLSKAHLLGFYEAAGGFLSAGPSSVQHGADTWYEMRLELGNGTARGGGRSGTEVEEDETQRE